MKVLPFARGHSWLTSICGCLALLCVCVGLPGCKTSTPTITRDGKIVDIDLANLTATVEFTKRNGTKLVIEGKPDPECKVTIDGRLAEFSEVQVGDRGTFSGYIDSTGGSGMLIAQCVIINRGSTQLPVMPPASTAPADASTTAPTDTSTTAPADTPAP